MTNFVLVQGAWGGGWYWRRTAQLLRQAGHEVLTPTLTGLGERRHLLTPAIGLQTHIQDILQVIRHEQLSDVVLVGHSYGGMVISGVADAAPQSIRSLVYLDAALPEDGQCMLEFVSPERRAMFLQRAQTEGDGWKVAPIPAAQWGIQDPSDQQWMDALFGFHPLKSFTDRIQLAGRQLTVHKKVFILATKYAPSPFQQFAARTRPDPAWTNYEIPAMHFTMVELPQETASALQNAA